MKHAAGDVYKRQMVRNAYQGIGSEYETLLKAFDRENEVFKKQVAIWLELHAVIDVYKRQESVVSTPSQGNNLNPCNTILFLLN